MSKQIKCIIVDDEPLAIDVIKDYVNQVPQLQLIATCSSAIDAFQVLQKEQVDLLFLDIQMPNLTGMELAKTLSGSPKVIFTTAYREYAIESYELDVVDYLLKPISFNRFFKAIHKYMNLTSKDTTAATSTPKENKGGSIYVYADKKNFKVYLDDILYLESLKDYVRIHTTEKKIVTKDTITHYQSLLPEGFLRIHRSFIVNIDKITAFTTHDVEIGTKELPIGVSYKKDIGERLKG